MTSGHGHPCCSYIGSAAHSDISQDCVDGCVALYVLQYHRVGRLYNRDEPGSPLTQYIANAGISLARYTITHWLNTTIVFYGLISNRISV